MMLSSSLKTEISPHMYDVDEEVEKGVEKRSSTPFFPKEKFLAPLIWMMQDFVNLAQIIAQRIVKTENVFYNKSWSRNFQNKRNFWLKKKRSQA